MFGKNSVHVWRKLYRLTNLLSPCSTFWYCHNEIALWQVFKKPKPCLSGGYIQPTHRWKCVAPPITLDAGAPLCLQQSWGNKICTKLFASITSTEELCSSDYSSYSNPSRVHEDMWALYWDKRKKRSAWAAERSSAAFRGHWIHQLKLWCLFCLGAGN